MTNFQPMRIVITFAVSLFAISLFAQMPTLLKDINPGGDGYGYEGSVVINDKLIFKANDGIHGIEPWVTDGTTNGTMLLLDCVQGLESPNTIRMIQFHDMVIIISYSSLNLSIWKTDGTVAGTELVTTINNNNEIAATSFIVSNDQYVFFPAKDILTGSELWKTDGTAIGTSMIKNISPYADWGPEALTIWNNTVFFYQDNGNDGNELWKTDGTTAGTVLVKDINPNGSSNYSQERIIPTPLGLFFVASDGVNGEELWISDGTSTGTRMVKNIHPGTDAQDEGAVLIDPNTNRDRAIFYNGKFYFQGINTANGYELWATDGTTIGTYKVLEGASGAQNFFVRDMLENQGKMYFIGDTPNDGRELWVSSGTSASTSMVKNIAPILFDGIWEFSNLTIYANKIWFVSDPLDDTGHEIWKSNGLASGTVAAFNLAPGNLSSYPHNLMVLNDKLIFFADAEGNNKLKLYAYRDASVAVEQPDNKSDYKISAYPNPSSGSFNLSIPETVEPESVELLDATANQVKSWKKVQRNQVFSCEGLPSGYYTIEVEDGQGGVFYTRVFYQNMH